MGFDSGWDIPLLIAYSFFAKAAPSRVGSNPFLCLICIRPRPHLSGRTSCYDQTVAGNSGKIWTKKPQL